MLNMLRMDLRRMFRAKMMFIAFLCLSAGILISIITLRTVTDPELRQQAIEAGVEITSDDQTDFNAIRSLTETQALCTTIYSGSFYFCGFVYYSGIVCLQRLQQRLCQKYIFLLRRPVVLLCQ